ncbi:heme anaerobic degradation radical SAM methyltransferase ChuW/HutW [Vibrio maerlii]|uniref:heme anaerobic degradation radical SAM methyltransferase ChuW/HutW n=1 Tax=Vibrio maerlii TaxID=2231648 RepID=UPI000E3D4FA2|nr:heme anaerobic degradation radical SAM methyltransferase ChuW/HutW [Vibrio maerlii]
MSFQLENYDSSVIGIASPDPLRFAFAKKTSAHAGGMARPIMGEQQQAIYTQVLTQPDTSRINNKRCLYIHIPFCRVRCTFCNFFQNAASRKLVDHYFSSLMTELKLKAKQPWTQQGRFHAVYIGGGTPTDLSPDQIQQLGQAIRDYFPLETDCEITLEGRINRFSDEMFGKALEGGFNRFSFGIQSFNTQVRRSAKRLDDREVVLERVSSLATTDAAPIVLDLLFGLPYQDLEVFEQDLKDFMSTGAHGVDLYQLVIGGDAPMLNLVEKGKIPPPASTPDKASMYELGSNFMSKHYVKQLSCSHWARDNRERSQYNSLAKTYAEVLPIGCGAGGNIGGYGLMHHRTLDAYNASIEKGELPVAMMTKQHAQADMFAQIKSGFDSGIIRRSELGLIEGQDLFDWFNPLFKHWQGIGLAELESDFLVLNLAGRFWSVSMAQAAIQILQTELQQMLKAS